MNVTWREVRDGLLAVLGLAGLRGPVEFGGDEMSTETVDRRPDYDELLRLAEAAPFNAADVPTFPPAADFLRAASPVVVAALIRENRQQAERIAALERAAHFVSGELRGKDGRPFSVSLAADLDHVLRESRP